MDKIKIGFVVNECGGWNGAIDFLADLIGVFKRHPEKYELELLLIHETPMRNLFKTALKKQKIDFYSHQIADCILQQCGNLTLRYYSNRVSRNNKESLISVAKRNNIDIVMPFLKAKSENLNGDFITVSYVYDFQHKHLPELFSSEEITYRDQYFEEQLKNSDFTFVQSRDTLNDVKTYFESYKDKVFVLYDFPHECKLDVSKDVREKYGLEHEYFIISNQFWMHKSHETVFEALEVIYNEGYINFDIVCTGETIDERNPKYFEGLLEKISKLNCKDNIHILGLIPKEDQMSLLKRSVALIQPTLFEGNPGGGSVVDAQSLGVHAIVSDIPINLEIPEYFSTSYFEKKNCVSLAEKMKEQIKERKIGRVPNEEIYEKFYEQYDKSILHLLKKNMLRKEV